MLAYFVHFVNHRQFTTANGTSRWGVGGFLISYNPSTNVLSNYASAAQYADLAERYEADEIMATRVMWLKLAATKKLTKTTVKVTKKFLV